MEIPEASVEDQIQMADQIIREEGLRPENQERDFNIVGTRGYEGVIIRPLQPNNFHDIMEAAFDAVVQHYHIPPNTQMEVCALNGHEDFSAHSNLEEIKSGISNFQNQFSLTSLYIGWRKL